MTLSLRTHLAGLFALAAALACGCSSSSSNGEATPPSGAADASATFQCASDPRVQTYVANLEETGVLHRARFTLTSASPAPPQRGLNAWTLRVVDTSGAAIPMATVTISGIMPDHQHGWSTQPTVTPAGDGMTFTFDEINLFMGGVWNVTFDVRVPQDGGPATVVDTATFTFCIG